MRRIPSLTRRVRIKSTARKPPAQSCKRARRTGARGHSVLLSLPAKRILLDGGFQSRLDKAEILLKKIFPLELITLAATAELLYLEHVPLISCSCGLHVENPTHR